VKTRIVVLAIIIQILAACQQHDLPGQAPLESKEPVAIESLPDPVVTDKMAQEELESQLAMRMAEEEMGIFFQERTGQIPPFPGEWVEKDGSRYCNGYMTRVESEDFCVSKVPSDWVPFEFDGQTYFVQPLTDINEQ